MDVVIIMFYVILNKQEQMQPGPVGTFLGKYLKVPLIDSMRMAKKAWGFLGERMEEAEANDMASAAVSAGLDARVIQEWQIPGLPEDKNVRSAHLTDDHFCFTLGSESTIREMPWDHICLLSAVGLNEEVRTTKTVEQGPSMQKRMVNMGITMATGIPVGFLKNKKKVDKTEISTEFFLYLDVFTKMPNPQVPEGHTIGCLHIDAQGFNFSYLADRKLPNIFGNFKLLIKDISDRSTAAVKNRGLNVMLANQPMNTQGYESYRDVDKEAKWLLAIT